MSQCLATKAGQVHNRALLIRWNDTPTSQIGNPVSHGFPTWFVVPDDLWDHITCAIADPNRTSARQWLRGAEPIEWINPSQPNAA